jgi:hypothetical protein
MFIFIFIIKINSNYIIYFLLYLLYLNNLINLKKINNIYYL